MAPGLFHLVAPLLSLLAIHSSVLLQHLPLVFSLYALSRVVTSTLLLSAILINSHYLSLALIIHSVPDSGTSVPTGHVHFMSDVLCPELNASS